MVRLLLLICCLLLPVAPCRAAEPAMADYTAYPVVLNLPGAADWLPAPDGCFGSHTDLRPEHRRHQVLKTFPPRCDGDSWTGKASGAAASILATSSRGEGILVQAFFRPRLVRGDTEIRWLGYLQGVWVDSQGNLREDTVNDRALQEGDDRILQFVTDPATGRQRVRKFAVSPQNPFPDTTTAPFEESDPAAVIPLWEAGARLAMRHPADRNVFTFLDRDGDQEVDAAEVTPFSQENAPLLEPYLAVNAPGASRHLGDAPEVRSRNLVDFIRGRDREGLRGRSLSIGGRHYVWKLGDLVNASPVAVSRPHMRYHTIYADESYLEFFKTHQKRETVIYAGGNDGMLHAFTAGVYDSRGRRFVRPEGAPEKIGDELWAYIPQSLLPHLKWLAAPDYTHTWFVDQTPRVVDARIDGRWRTLLIGGLGLGGKPITAEGDFKGTGEREVRTFKPAYFCLDVTDPRRPELLWERTYDGLGFSFGRPEVIKVGGKWFAVFGSGPTDYQGNSRQAGRIFVVDLATGAPYRNADGADFLFATGESEAFFGSPAAIDKDLTYDFSHDAVYLGQTFRRGDRWQGKIYRLLTNGDDNPSRWAFGIPLLDVGRPVTGGLALATDPAENVWLYFGTGRYLGPRDRGRREPEYLFGVKDPYFNPSFKGNPLLSLVTLKASDLFCADGFQVTTGQIVAGGGQRMTWKAFRDRSDAFGGWYRTLTAAGERCVTRPLVFGGTVLAPTCIPGSGSAVGGGQTRFHALYYLTGTASPQKIFPQGGGAVQVLGGREAEVVVDAFSFAPGAAPPSLALAFGEGGAVAYSQRSTGTLDSIPFIPPLDMRSGLVSWLEN